MTSHDPETSTRSHSGESGHSHGGHPPHPGAEKHDHGPSCSHEHAHDHGHDHAHESVEARKGRFSEAEAKQARRLKWVLGTVSSFFVVEFAGARLARSAVLEADALHLLMDIFALGMSLWAMRLSVRPPSGKYTFGLRRAEPLAALLNAVLILVTTAEIIHESIGHLRGEEDPKGSIMLAVAILALAVNGVSAWLLHGVMDHKHHGHGHDHGHDHAHHDHGHAVDISEDHAARGHQLNLRGAWLHLMGDILGSLAALLAAFVVKLGGPSWADPVASFLVVIILIVGALRLVRDALAVLLESAPAHLPVEEVRAALLAVENVGTIEVLNVWTLGAGQDAVMARIITKVADVGAGARAAAHLKKTFELDWVAVQADPPV